MRLVLDEAHYREVVEHGLLGAKQSIWIATANIKDAHIESPIGSVARARGTFRSLFEWLKSKADAGLDVRVLHAARPSRILAANRAWQEGGALHRACPRVHMKMVVVDGRYLYLGSANVTGAGLGAKSDGRRNFEAGIVTDDSWMLDELQRAFHDTWSGRRCLGCQLRRHCPAPIDRIAERAGVSMRRTKPEKSSMDAARACRVGRKVPSRGSASLRRTKPKDASPERRIVRRTKA
jgi:phosphatidylserine/phosphatidylglycerophosphate/cardiolipin synthase-like enzyme